MERRHLTLGGVVVLILMAGLLAAVLLPSRQKVREGARRSNCKSNLRQLGLAMHLYADDNDGAFPNSGGLHATSFDGQAPAPMSGLNALKLLLPKYVEGTKLFKCSDTKDDYSGFSQGPLTDANGGSYAYDPRHQAAHAGGVAIAADRRKGTTQTSGNHERRGANVLFADAHVAWIPAPTGAKVMVADDKTDLGPDAAHGNGIWNPGAAGYEHDTCLVR